MHCTQSNQSHRSQERSAMYPPVPGVPDFLRSDRRLAAAASQAAEPSSARHPGPDAAHDARAGAVSESLQVHPGRAHLPALGLDDQLGRTRHPGAQQPQVRRLEQRRLLFRRARAGSGAGDPDLFHRAGAACSWRISSRSLTYVYARNQTVPDDQKVLTPYHFGEVANDILFKLGMKPLFNRDVGTVDRAGPPIMFVGKTPGIGQGRSVAGAPGRGIAIVHGGQGAGLRRRDAAGDRHPPGADDRTAFRALSDRRHPARRRAVRPADRRRRGQRLQGALGDGHLREAEAAGRLVRRQASGPRPRFPRGHLGLEGGREAGHANPRQQRQPSPSSKTWGCGPS